MIIDLRIDDCMSTFPVSVEIHDRAHGTIDGKLLPVNPKTRDLRVKI